ncbi:hypothetical protein DL93DRAFT_2165546 [Clavulina sp. PMI_390]|nr:hypothetical protein DL93DRAFT_2165546 [Clavulina sp. PMI_390]
MSKEEEAMEVELSQLVSHTRLRITNASDALATMFLVECGVLPPGMTDGPLPEEVGTHLGHGNVYVFLNEVATSPKIKIQDGRKWQPPIKKNGLYWYRDTNESSSLSRLVLTAKKNTVVSDNGLYWHLVAYIDHSRTAEALLGIATTPRFAQCVAYMPFYYFVPEFGCLAPSQPHLLRPHPRVPWKQIALSLPPPPAYEPYAELDANGRPKWTRAKLPPADIETNTETRIVSVEVFEAHPEDMLANARVGPEAEG